MKKIYKTTIWSFVVMIACTTLVTSCTDDTLPNAERLFRPIIADNDIEAGLNADTVPYIKVSWANYSNADQYVIKAIASDGTDSVSITTDSTSCTFANMKFDKEYNIKIRSKNTVSGLESKDFIVTATTPDFPTQLVNISSTNIIDTQVRIVWNPVQNGIATVFDTLKVFNISNDSLEVSVPVTPVELSAGQKIIRKLHASTKYRLEAYHNGKYKGKKLFTTTAAESYSGLVIDLRGLTADDSYKYFSVASGSLYANKIDSIVKANPDQTITFVLQGGVSYRMPTLLIPATAGKIKFATGLSLNGLATFAVTGNFDAVAGATIGGLDFTNIIFSSAPLESAYTPSYCFGNTYLFNFGNAGANVKSINLSGCKVNYKRGVIREKADVVVDTFNIKNCIIDSIGSYGVMKIDATGAVIKNISVFNSTFSNCQYFISGKSGMTNSMNTVDVENSTFVYCILNSKTLFDLTYAPTVSQIILKNCLFGISGGSSTTPPTLDATTGLITGIAGWSGTLNIPNASGCYFTNDFLWYTKAGATAPVAQIDGTKLSTTTTATFKSPATKDFKIISSELTKLKVGDPRWY